MTDIEKNITSIPCVDLMKYSYIYAHYDETPCLRYLINPDKNVYYNCISTYKNYYNQYQLCINNTTHKPITFADYFLNNLK